MIQRIIVSSGLLLTHFFVGAQQQGNFTGNMESTFQFLNKDSLIGANQPVEKGLLNSYANVFYTNGGFKAGMRVESYLPRINGYPNRFDGTGLGMRYVGYSNDVVDVTLGNFYEQFGSGMALRIYEDRNLGYDNTLDGMRIILRPRKGVQLKGIYGQQRFSFVNGLVVKSPGLVRGFDADFSLHQLIPQLDSSGVQLSLGGSFVSKYQRDDNPSLILPENVAVYGGRFDFRYKKITVNGEYMTKSNDPSEDNGNIYNSGHAALLNIGYTKKGLGILLSAKSVDNMSFRSDRTQQLQDVLINFLPALNKTHSYNLVATLYPYVTSPVGEIAYQGEVLYNLKKGTFLNQKYAIPFNVNFSTAYLPVRHTSQINPMDSTGITYKGIPFDMSSTVMWQDINANVTYKINKNFSVIASYFNITLNNSIAKVADAPGIIRSNIAVAEINYKFNKTHSLRTEIQWLKTGKSNPDKGDWATLILEYNVSPHWFFSVMDQYNYGNPNPNLRLHYALGAFGWTKDATRVSVFYGRQRAGLFCVGGVCRQVPASNGLTISFTQSF